MNILSTWRESLRFFLPAQIKPFALITLKTLLYPVKVHIALLLIACIMGSVFHAEMALCYSNDLIRESWKATLFLIQLFSFYYLMWFFFFLIFRPSIQQKNSAYLKKYCFYVIKIFPLLLLFCIFLKYAFFGIDFLIFFARSIDQTIVIGAAGLLFLLLFSIQMIAILFFLDSDGALMQNCYALQRAFILVIYNVPLFVILLTLIMGIMYGLWIINSMVLIKNSYFNEVFSTMGTFLYPFFSSILLTNIYIQKIHEQPDLYLKHPVR